MTSRRTFTEHMVAGLKTYVYGLNENQDGPVVFFLHGLRGSVQSALKYCNDLAKNGFIAIAIDQRNHGARSVDLSKNQSGSDNYLVNTYGVYTGTARDISTIIDFLPAALGITTDQIGVCGFSLGAHASFITAVNDERIKAVVPICGTSDRKSMLEQRFIANGGNAEQFESEFSEVMIPILERFDPINNLDKLKGRAICMINGGSDTIVPPDTNVVLKEKLLPLYDDQSKLALSIYPDAVHEITPAMWFECINWFNRFLK